MARLRDENLTTGVATLLSRRQDDFSVQYSLPSDPRFWVRVALPLTRPVVLTDFFLGSQDDQACAEVLDFVLHDLRVADAASLEFARLGDAGTSQAEDNVARLGRVLDAYVILTRRFVRLRKVSVDRGQANLRVMLWDTNEPGEPEQN